MKCLERKISQCILPLTQVFFCEYCEIFKNITLHERTLNIYKTFRGQTSHFLNVLSTFNLHPTSKRYCRVCLRFSTDFSFFCQHFLVSKEQPETYPKQQQLLCLTHVLILRKIRAKFSTALYNTNFKNKVNYTVTQSQAK